MPLIPWASYMGDSLRWAALAKLRDSANKKLVSPAIAHDKAWLRVRLSHLPQSDEPTVQRFLALTSPDCKPDYLAVHVYTTTFEAFRSAVEGYWEEFRLPIVVSEFAMQVSHFLIENGCPPNKAEL